MENKKPTDNGDNKKILTPEELKLKQTKEKIQRERINRLKNKYFDLYDDIKISDRQDW